jgi:UDP-N-acetylmuramoylalanine--D-glutamate ligase
VIDLSFFSGLPVAVLGLGKSGLSAARALHTAGAEVWAWDDNEDARAKARAKDIPLVDLHTCNWSELTTLVISPGIPHNHPKPHPVAALARKHNAEVICDIELLGRAQHNAQYLGITGTNGKSTTTALIGHIFQLAGREVAIGGNLGIPVLDLDALYEGGTYVLEMSSYQLELTLSITFDIAILLNISPDHLERHGGLDGYIAAKRQIFHRQTKPRTAVIGVDDEICRKIYETLRAADEQVVIPVSGAAKCPGGVYVRDGILHDDSDGQDLAIMDLREVPSLPGAHNWQNAAAAYAACKTAGIEPPVIVACLRSFPGLAHRQELVAIIDGISYVNDSKATNADAAAKALSCYDPIYWIAGGQAKEGGIKGLEVFFPRIAHTFLIGEAEASFSAFLDGRVAVSRCGTLDKAVPTARELAVAEGRSSAVVLLSPACASFDQFANFEARGTAFRKLVEALPGRREEAVA